MTKYTPNDGKGETAGASDELFCGSCEACPFRSRRDDPESRRLSAGIYAALGYAVYPRDTRSGGHYPGLGRTSDGNGGFYHATDQPAEAAGLFRRFPAANTGVRTGRESRLIIVDCDVRTVSRERSSAGRDLTVGDLYETRRGEDALAEWEAETGLAVPRDAIETTPSGGRHIWLRIPRGHENGLPTRTGAWGEPVDVLMDNWSAQVAPATKYDDDNEPVGSYCWDVGCPCVVPEAPGALLDAFGNLTRTPARASSREPSESAGGGVDVDAYRSEGIPVGQQRLELLRCAGSMAVRGQNDAEIAQALHEIIAASEQDASRPWTDADVAKLVSEAQRFAERARRDDPLDRLTRWAPWRSGVEGRPDTANDGNGTTGWPESDGVGEERTTISSTKLRSSRWNARYRPSQR